MASHLCVGTISLQPYSTSTSCPLIVDPSLVNMHMLLMLCLCVLRSFPIGREFRDSCQVVVVAFLDGLDDGETFEFHCAVS